MEKSSNDNILQVNYDNKIMNCPSQMNKLNIFKTDARAHTNHERK